MEFLSMPSEADQIPSIPVSVAYRIGLFFAALSISWKRSLVWRDYPFERTLPKSLE